MNQRLNRPTQPIPVVVRITTTLRLTTTAETLTIPGSTRPINVFVRVLVVLFIWLKGPGWTRVFC